MTACNKDTEYAVINGIHERGHSGMDCIEILDRPLTRGSNIYKSCTHRRKMFRVSEVRGCLCDTFSALILINNSKRHFLSQTNNVFF